MQKLTIEDAIKDMRRYSHRVTVESEASESGESTTTQIPPFGSHASVVDSGEEERSWYDRGYFGEISIDYL